MLWIIFGATKQQITAMKDHATLSLNSALFAVKFHLNTCYINFSEMLQV